MIDPPPLLEVVSGVVMMKGVGEYFDSLFMELPFEVGRLPRFPTMRIGPIGSEMYLCCYTNTGTRYPLQYPHHMYSVVSTYCF